MMPRKDGFEVCETLKTDERTSHIPIILLTAKADIESRIAGLRRGADAYLAKPFHQEELLVRIDRLLALRRQLQQRYQSPEPLPASSEAGLQQEDAFIKKVREIVEAHLERKDFGIPELCAELDMSRSQLHNKLKALTGRSTSHYLRSIRLHKARQLLESTDDQISDIADQVGFQHATYFSRLFSEEFGVSPREFRN